MHGPHRARCCPAAAYVDDDVLRWENRHFFESGWVCVGRSDALTAAG